ncbi:helix-turn-helix domain-containing protein [Intestinibacter sp.]|uniref:helix-turn-helix domain-containing protein n=1 Tax=Intestinibacter sp. TaxID=1965304 RepID=UPI003F1504C2
MEDNSNIAIEIGKKIRNIRKSKNMKLEDLAIAINKTKSTLSKYERGIISVDICTLYDISDALGVHIDQLLYNKQYNNVDKKEEINFFSGCSRLYTYIYDGRNNKVIISVIDITSRNEDNSYKTKFYMNIKDYDDYQNCENTYYGFTKHYDILTHITLYNQSTKLETMSINILASFLDTNKKWGLISAVSFRPFMPVSTKILFCKEPLEITPELIKELRISKEDIRIMKLYNMFVVTQ